jgi:hypothetical protein
MPSDEATERLRDEVSGNEEIETTFRRLRHDGHSRLEAVRMILDVLDVSLAEAKELLMRSDTWNEVQSATGPDPEAEGNAEDDGYDDPVPPAPA